MTAIAVWARRRLDGSTLSLVLLCLAQFVLILDAAVVAVALPVGHQRPGPPPRPAIESPPRAMDLQRRTYPD
jgi:hypothetical protein